MVPVSPSVTVGISTLSVGTVCAAASVASPKSSGRHSSPAARPRRRRRAVEREPAATRAGERSKLLEEEAGRRVSERRPADAEDSGGEASGREQSLAEDAGDAIRRSGDPAIRRSGDPAIRRSGDPAIRRSGDYSEGSPLSACQPTREIIFRALSVRTVFDGPKRCAQRADRISSFVEDGHRDLSEPVARPAGAHSAQICRASPVPFDVPYAEHAAKASQRRSLSRVLESQRALTSKRRRRCPCRYRPLQSRRPQHRYRA